MICEYDLETAPLYSIKWYFGDSEFYRYVPKESPPTRVFPVPGISVDVSKSDNVSVTLRSVQRDLTGYYKCEISADAPLFHTDIKSVLIFVIEKPEVGPLLSVSKSKYAHGEVIQANCSSKRAFPAVNITWFLNGKALTKNGSKLDALTILPEFGGLETSRSSIRIIATVGMFENNRLRLGCVASQFDLYNEMTEIELLEDTPQLAHVFSPVLSAAVGSNVVVIRFIELIICVLTLAVIVGNGYYNIFRF